MFRLTGVSPFMASTDESIIRNNDRCEIAYPDTLWEGISLEAKELVMIMTYKDPDLRISLKEAMSHPWFSSEILDSDSVPVRLE